MRTTEAKIIEALAEVNRWKPDDRKWILESWNDEHVFASRPYDCKNREFVRWHVGHTKSGDLYFFGGHYTVEEAYERLFMNPKTGSVDTYDGWEYIDENGDTVNAVDLGEVGFLGYRKQRLARERGGKE